MAGLSLAIHRDRYILLFGITVFVVQLFTLRPPIVIGEPYFIAENMLHGLGYAYAYPGQPGPEITAYIPPLYAYFCYAVISIYNSILVLQVVNLVILQIAVYALYRFALQVLGPRAARLTYVAASIYLPFWLLAEAAEPNAFNMLLLILTISLLHRLVCGRQLTRDWLWLGIVVGLQVLVRPDMLIGAVLFAIWLFVVRGSVSRKEIARIVLKSSGVAILLILPWAIRNWVVFHEFVPVSANAGYNFYLGNNPWATGEFNQEPNADFSEFDRYLTSHSAIEQDRYYLSQGIRWVAADPAMALKLAVRKFYYHWWHRERSGRNIQVGGYEKAYDLVTMLLLLLAITGFVLLREKRLQSLIVILFLYSSLVSVIFFVQSRHRTLKVDPYLILLSSYAVVRGYEAFQRKNLFTDEDPNR